ncbi:Protein tyrosine kinase [Phytophthora infestans]|uniref:Protein tyrosine kinase n=1 Tax=Phytophthora infestans TaxID=4787 RepID=A0A833WK64_PHYIN|nr:Protein tyrosine kinase [Phytophthora infestans]
MFLKNVVLQGIPDFDAPPKGGCTPFLQILPAPSQHHQPGLLYNSSWQRTQFETFVADPNGAIIYEVNTEVQGDVLMRCLHAKNQGKQMVPMLHFTNNTAFISMDLPKAELDEASNDERFPDSFHVEINLEMCISTDNLSCASSSSLMLTQRDRDIPSNQIKLAGQRWEKSPVAIQGWLYTQGGFFKTWKKRWVVARDGKILNYRDQMDAAPLDFSKLGGATVEICGASEVNARNKTLHYFKVVPSTTTERTYIYASESEQDLVAWIQALSVQCANETVKEHEASSRKHHLLSNTVANKEECQMSSEASQSYATSDSIPSLKYGNVCRKAGVSPEVANPVALSDQDSNTLQLSAMQLITSDHAVTPLINLLEMCEQMEETSDMCKKTKLADKQQKDSWIELWEHQRQEVDARLLLLWKTNPERILDTISDEENALLLLNSEARASQDTYNTYSIESRALLRSVAETVVRLSAASVPVVPGWFIADHEVQREKDHFARGSFGKIYRGTWRGTKVVIKCVNVTSTKEDRDFSREARVWLRAQHPNIVKLYGACHLTQPCFFVCDEVTNGNLVDFLVRIKGSDSAITWRLLHDAALGLQSLHQNNIVHGDLKCNQILVSEDLTAKLTDFGMSFVSLESRPTTTSGAVRWKAPELLTHEGCAPTFASDIYSFGMCVVEARSGGVPWRSDLPNVAVIYHLTHGTFLSRPEAFKSDEQWEFVRSLCAFKPSERLGLDAAIEQLDRFARQEQLNAAGG